MSSSPAMVDAPHHPPKGAFAQSADDLICNTAQRQEGRRERAGDKKGKRELATWTRAAAQQQKTTVQTGADPLFKWLCPVNIR